MKYELWESKDGLTFIPSSNHDAVLEDAKLIWSIEAESWVDACQKYYEFMGFGLYKPFDEK